MSNGASRKKKIKTSKTSRKKRKGRRAIFHQLNSDQGLRASLLRWKCEVDTVPPRGTNTFEKLLCGTLCLDLCQPAQGMAIFLSQKAVFHHLMALCVRAVVRFARKNAKKNETKLNLRKKKGAWNLEFVCVRPHDCTTLKNKCFRFIPEAQKAGI